MKLCPIRKSNLNTVNIYATNGTELAVCVGDGYLRLDGTVGEETFGFDRYLNQQFYRSIEWRAVRDFVIVRDNGCDLGAEGYEIFGRIYIHHMNPISVRDIERKSDVIFNPEFLICAAFHTHNAIHFGDEGQIDKEPVERRPNDTCPWRR